MRRLITALIVILLLALIAAGLLWFGFDRIVIAAKPSLEEELSALLKTPVRIGNISFGFLPKAHATLSGLQIDNIPHSSIQKLAIAEVQCSLEWRPLLQKRLEISKLTLIKPEIWINQALGSETKEATPGQAAAPSPGRQQALDVALQAIDIQAGEIHLTTLNKQQFEVQALNLVSELKLGPRSATFVSPALSATVAGFPLRLVTSGMTISKESLLLAPATLFALSSELKLEAHYSAASGGEASLTGSNLEIKTFSPLLNLAPALSDLHLDGRFSPTLRLFMKPEDALRTEAQFELHSGQAQIHGISIVDAQGRLLLSHSARGLHLHSDNLQGRTQYSPEKIDAVFDFDFAPFQGKLALKGRKLDLAALSENLLGVLKPYTPTGEATGDVTLNFTPHKPLLINGEATLSHAAINIGGTAIKQMEGRLRFSPASEGMQIGSDDLTLEIRDQLLQARGVLELQKEESFVRNLTLEGLGGSIEIKGHLTRTPRAGLSAQLNAKNVSLERLLAMLLPQQRFNVQAPIESLAADVRISDLHDLEGTISGSGKLRLGSGVIRGINLPRLVLEKADDLPFTRGSLFDYVPPQFVHYFKGEDTPFQSLQAEMNTREGRLELTQVLLLAEVFHIAANGSAGFDNTLDFETQFIYSAEFSKSLARGIGQLNRVLRNGEELVIPAHIGGTLQKVKVKPDVRRLVESAASNTAEDLLRKLLKNAERRH